MRNSGLLVIGLLAATLLIAQQRTFGTSTLSESGKLLLSYSSELTPITINTMHSWILHVESAAGGVVENAEISMAGGMPDHDHGLPTAPRMTRYLGDGNYLMEGMRFHMHGRWVVTAQIAYGEDTDSVVFELEL